MFSIMPSVSAKPFCFIKESNVISCVSCATRALFDPGWACAAAVYVAIILFNEL